MRTGKKRRRTRGMNIAQRALFGACLTVFVVSTFLFCRYVITSAARKHENESLSVEYSDSFVAATAAEFTTEPESTAYIENTAEPVYEESIAIPETFRSMQGEKLPKAYDLMWQNQDIVGWLRIDDVVDLPVVYRDNEFYLNHDFNGDVDSGGTLFLDENHPLLESTQSLVIHGHDMHDGSMFGKVSNYDKLSYVRKYPFAVFSTLYAREDYVIFAVLQVDTDPENDDFFNYIGRPRFGSPTEFYDYVESMRSHSMFDIPVDVRHTDSLLALSTCVNDDRLVVVFRRVRENENMDQLRFMTDQAVDME